MAFIRRKHRWIVPATVVACAGAAHAVSVQVPARVGAMFGTRTVTGLGQPFVNGNGDVGFVMLMDDSTRSIYYGTGEVFNSSSIAGHTVTGSEDTMGISNAGNWIYSPSYDAGDAVLTDQGLLLGQPNANPAVSGTFSTFNSRPRMADDGTAYWIGGWSSTQGGSTNNRGLLRNSNPANPAGTTVVEMGGDVVSGLTLSSTATGFAFDISGNAAHYIRSDTFTGVPSTSDTGIVKDNAVVLREGDPTGGGDNWQNWRFVSVNNSGNYAVCGDTSGTLDDFVTFNNSIVARQGQVVAGVTLGSTVDMVSINNLNQIAMIWDITSNTDEGLFIGDGATLASSAQLLLRTGDPLDVNNDNIADFTLTDFTASAAIAPGLDLADQSTLWVSVTMTSVTGGSPVEAIIGVQIPAPSATGLLAFAGLCGARRRRR